MPGCVKLLKPVKTALEFYGILKNDSFISWMSIIVSVAITDINAVILIASIHHNITSGKFKIQYSGLAISALFSVFLVNIMLVSLKKCSSEIRFCLEEMGNFVKIKKPIAVEKLNKQLCFIANSTTLCLVVWGIITMFYFAKIDCPENVASECGTFLNMEIPWDIHYTPMRQIVAVVQVFSGFYATIFMAHTIMLICFIADLMTNKLIHLRNMIRRVPEIKYMHRRRMYMIICIKYHQDILEIFQVPRALLAAFGGLLLIACNLIITLSTYMLIHKFDFSCMLHAMCYIIGLVMAATAGEHMLEQSNQLRHDIFYSIPWQDCDIRTWKDMYFMLIRTSKLMKMEVMESVDGIFLSMPIVLYIIKMTYSIVNILLQNEN